HLNTPSTAKPGSSSSATLKHKLTRQQTSQALRTTQPAAKNLAKSQKRSTASSVSVASSQPQESTLDAAPDWLETEATPVGYVKHPLERLLEWLDQIMLWVEERIVNLWTWMRKKV
ncbi:MAG: hypothetical protein ACRDEA_09045, partial [Microcystaceae cyanobacterium]